MDMVRIKVIIDGKVKYFAYKDKDGNIFLQDKKSDGLPVEAIAKNNPCVIPISRERFWDNS